MVELQHTSSKVESHLHISAISFMQLHHSDHGMKERSYLDTRSPKRDGRAGTIPGTFRG